MRLIANRAAAGWLLGLALWGCSEPDTPASVTIIPSAVFLDALGATQQLSAVVKNKDGKDITGAAVTWSSDNAQVATVSETGLVTAVSAGSARIKATAGTITAEAPVTVTQNPTQVEAVSGRQQTGTVGQQLPQPLVVRVRDRLNNGIAGLSVSFSVSADGGSVSPQNATTDAQGEASTVWTLGTKAGSYQVVATISGANQSVTFSARADPGPAAILSKVAGDNQFGFHGTRLDTLIAVLVRDQFGNPVRNHAVLFETDPGNGTPDSSVAFTDSTGTARTGWVMPVLSGGPGTVSATVSLRAIATGPGGAPLTGSPRTFTAVAHNVRVESVSPTPLVEGQAATITGTGFDPNAANNLVTVDGVAAAVTAASATSLTITVPTYDCKPQRPVNVRVTVSGIPSRAKADSLRPASFLNLAVGEQLIVRNPADFCFQFARASGTETYLVGVQSVSETATNLTAVTVSGSVPGAASAGPASFLARVGTAGAAPRTRGYQGSQAVMPGRFDAERLRLWRRHREVELEQREFDRMIFEAWSAGREPRAAALLARAAARVPDTAAVGDTVRLKITTSNSCTSNLVDVTAVIQAKGDRAFFLADIANPTGGFEAVHYQSFSAQFDSLVYPALVDQFGAFTDMDGNNRVVIVASKEVNRRGSLGFTTSCDFFPRSSNNQASNEGEFFYIAVPDPSGNFGTTYSLDRALENMPSVLAHEPVHVLQFGRRVAAGGSLPATWVSEGQATLGEEIVGHRAEGRQPGQNYGLGVILNEDSLTSPTDWYSGMIVALSLYFGWDPITTGSSDGRAQNAPHECSWLTTKPQGISNWPCVGGLDPYGAPWSLLRYLSDRFGPSRGGEDKIHKAILDHAQPGYSMLASVIGMPIDSILAQWAAMLYADDRVSNPVLNMTSWNLLDIYYGTSGGFRLIPALRLIPDPLSFNNFTKNVNVRAGSTYYALISGSNRPPTAFKARDGAGNILPSHMRLWIVRIE
ncbi:MAG: hypothetical protein KatS3mg081_2087 [Gemmatimonadales bacterium]|nr:MAG: hypothetical protein KatS3mg081_2087 [Gemmatimonadales bacterium]